MGTNSGWTRFAIISESPLVTHHINDDRPRAGTVPVFPEVYALPYTQRQLALHDWHPNLHRCQRPLDVRGHIVRALLRMGVEGVVF